MFDLEEMARADEALHRLISEESGISEEDAAE